ncbi:MAG TPA: amidohydrolase family protein [Propionibacteriaceae bacterium]|nr:amidohydrolase family protein [Propionibacteriaceae bacterium]
MIDTHLHVWRLATGWYPWNIPELGDVHADSTVDEVAGAMARAGVTSVVLVQAADTLAETDWLLDLARHDERVAGVVGFLPLADPARLGELLARYADEPLLGIRQLWHDHDRADELTDPAVLTSLGRLGEAGLAVDVPDAHPRLWPALTRAVEQVPQTTFVLDHCGKPPFGDPAGWSDWEARFTALAALPNVVIKLSGLFGGSGSSVPATTGELDRVVELARALAGADRVMVGSDWPMIRGTLDYGETVAGLRRLLRSWSAQEQVAATETTARTTYHLWAR